MSSKVETWYAVYNSQKAEYGVVLRRFNEGYDPHMLFYRTRNNADAIAFARELNLHPPICRGSIVFANNCGHCPKCRYSY